MTVKRHLTHISNPQSHILIEQVEDENDDKIDAGCGN